MEMTKEYPAQNIDPNLKKEKKWLLENAQAFWYDTSNSTPSTMFAANRSKYDLWRLYGIGKQPNGKYKPLMGVDVQNGGETYMNINWEISPFFTHLRDKLIAKIMQQGFNVIATPIDMNGRDENMEYYADLKAKLMMQKALSQMQPELAGHPELALNAKDPRDLEELEMRMNYGEQFNRALNAELCCELALYQNKFIQIDREVSEDLVDYGVAGMIDDLDCNGNPILRRADPRHLMVSYCCRSDFSDMTRWAEIIEVSKTDLQQHFSVEELDKVNNSNTTFMTGGNLNGLQDSRGKLKVMHMEFFSTDGFVWEGGIDKNGNQAFTRAEFRKTKSTNPKYTAKSIKQVYTCKWVVGTELIYEYGLKNDMKRSVDKKALSNTTLSLHLQAYNFHEMMAQGFTERVISVIDDIQLDIYKIRNFKNKMIPNGFFIDFDSLENVALGKGGTNMTPRQLLDMFVETGLAVGRRKDVGGATNNAKPFEPLINSNVNEVAGIANEIQRNMAMLSNMLGLNEMTDGSTPSPKMLNGVATMMTQNTNNSLYPIVQARKTLIEVKCGELMKRVQQTLRRNGSYNGYAPALNSNVMKMVKADKELTLRDFAIKLEIRPTEEEKQLLMMNMQEDKRQGLLDASDEFMILNTSNMKQAEMMLAFRVKKNKELMQQMKDRDIQNNGQMQQQSLAMSHQNSMEQLQAQTESKAYLIKLEKDLDLRNAQEALMIQGQQEDKKNKSGIAKQLIGANTKKDIERMKQGGSVVDDDIELGDMDDVAPLPPMLPPQQPEMMEQPVMEEEMVMQ